MVIKYEFIIGWGDLCSPEFTLFHSSIWLQVGTKQVKVFKWVWSNYHACNNDFCHPDMLDSEPAQLSACSVLIDGSIYKQHMSGDVLTGRWAHQSHHASVSACNEPFWWLAWQLLQEERIECALRQHHQGRKCAFERGAKNVGLGLALKAAIIFILMGHHKQQPALSSLSCLMPNCAE